MEKPFEVIVTEVYGRGSNSTGGEEDQQGEREGKGQELRSLRVDPHRDPRLRRRHPVLHPGHCRAGQRGRRALLRCAPAPPRDDRGLGWSSGSRCGRCGTIWRALRPRPTPTRRRASGSSSSRCQRRVGTQGRRAASAPALARPGRRPERRRTGIAGCGPIISPKRGRSTQGRRRAPRPERRGPSRGPHRRTGSPARPRT